jgi:hypothetical protein
VQRGVIIRIIDASERWPQSRRGQSLIRGEDDSRWSLHWIVSANIIAVPHALLVLYPQSVTGRCHHRRGRLYGGVSSDKTYVAK